MRSEAELRAFFEMELTGSISELEEIRAGRMARYRRFRAGFIAMCILGAFAGMVAMADYGGACFIPPFLGLFIGIVVTAKYKERLFQTDLRGRFKHEVMTPLVRFLDPTLTYEPDRYHPRDLFAASGIVQHEPTRYQGDDLVRGRLGETDFLFSELKVEHRDKSSDSSNTTTLFQGLFFSADFHKHFHGFTIIVPRRAPVPLRTNLGFSSRETKMKANFAFMENRMLPRWLPERSRYQPLQEIELEDPQFHEYFQVYSTDQVEARYILSPSLMERLVVFRRGLEESRDEAVAPYAKKRKFIQVMDVNKLASANVAVSFAQSNVFVAKQFYKPLFELKPEQSIDCFIEIGEYAQDLQFGLGLVEELNLNTRIWSKVGRSE
jgi:hypothetical protein